MKISVIIPAYNIADCIERCIKSVCAQTHEDIEILVIDDGSTDDTARIAKDLAAGDPRIRVISKENGGTSSARNLGIKEAAGEYIGFVDADDYVSPDMYEKLLNMLTDPPISDGKKQKLLIAQVCRDELAEDGSTLPMVVTPPDKPVVISNEDFLKELLLHRGDCSMCTKLVPKSVLMKYGFPEGELNEDFRIFTQIITDPELFGGDIADGIGSLPDICYHVCYRSGSNTRTSGNTFSRVYRDIVVNADRITELVNDRYPELKEYAVRFSLVQRLDYLLHIPIALMKRDDPFYLDVVSYVKRHRKDISTNPYLSDDERKKLRILSVSPKAVRSAHAAIKRIR